MAVPLEQFVKQLEDSGILLGETLKGFIPPKADPKDAEELARELVRKKKLTKFQAEEVYRGKGKSLTLGNYVLMEKIGAGGMGQVFKAEHRRMHRIVAIKVLPPNLTKDAAAIARFEREVTAAAKISHPNIVAAHDADCANGIHFLVMELVEGNDLSALVKKNGPLSVEKAVNYVLQAARGLEAAHKKGIVHRDIKPANLLLDNEGIVKILDMGLARLSGDAEGIPQADLTSTGTIMGTVDYMAPEQALDTKTADARADIYALGCSLFYLLTGTATYEGDTIMQKLLAHRERPIPSLRSVRAEVPDQLEIVFKTMLAKKVEDRFQTMTEVVAALETCGRFPVVDSTGLAQTALFEAVSSPPTIAAQTENVSKPPIYGKKKLLIGGAVLGVAILAGLVVKLKTQDGTLVVTVNEPDAEVQVLNEEGKVEISQKGGKDTISISVDPGKHRLKVTKDGFSVFGQDFEIEAGGKQPITATLEPLKDEAIVATAGWHGWTADAPKPAISPFDAGQAKKHQEAWAAYLKIPVEYTNSIGMTFRLIPPGEFTMGSTPEEIGEAIRLAGEDKHWQECIRTETPQHKAILTQPIYFSTHEVTQAQYNQLIGKNPSHFAPTGAGKDTIAGMDTASHPVENVSWNDAADFCAKLCEREKLRPFYSRRGETVTMQEGDGYRLPTEAEWEFSCRAGSITKYWIGDKNENFAQAGWSTENSVGRTHAVGQLKSNPFGIYDTHGNVWEWVEDEWSPSYYYQFQEKSALDPSGPPWAGSQRVLRGGDWNVAVSGCRSSFRYVAPDTRSNGIGFRMALRVDAVRQSGLDGVKKPLAFQKPEFDQWMKEVSDMAAEKQIAAVARKLAELNPGFDGMVTNANSNGTPKIENGVVMEFRFASDHVTDISPVRALRQLKTLRCDPSTYDKKSRLSDLSPLQGMGLTYLSCFGNLVSDLSPLEGMPLAYLDCGATPVRNLNALKGMPLTELRCGGMTHLSDLSPLAGMSLKVLYCYGTSVSDLSPLDGMPLKVLYCFKTPVSDLSPLHGMNLTGVSITPTNITRGLDVIRQMKSIQTIGTGYWNNQLSPDEFWKKYDAGEFGKPFTDLTSPDFKKWMKDVQAMSAEEQIESVSKKLVELNPGFDGEVTDLGGNASPVIENGVVTGIGFVTDHVADISPVRALAGLSRLSCHPATHPNGKLEDLSPLRGLQLVMLSCVGNQIHDLSPLAGMKLVELNCGGNPIADISPLQGMPLRSLNVGSTLVSELSTLKGMPLKELSFDMTKVTTLSWLEGMALEQVFFQGTSITDLSPLKGMPMEILNCARTQISNLSPLKGMPLASVYCSATPITDVSLLEEIKSLQTLELSESKVTAAGVAALQKALPDCKITWDGSAKPITDINDPAFQAWMKEVAALSAEQQVEAVAKKLVELNPGFDGQVTGGEGRATPRIEDGVVTEFQFFTDNVTDISPVRALAGLKGLFCGGSTGWKGKLSDLSPLRGMPLTRLYCWGTPVSNLSPLEGMSLTYLECGDTQVSNLSPLKGMPLTNLQCNVTQISDLSPLEGCTNLKFLALRATKVTRAGVASLQKALPNCKIEWDDPAKTVAGQPSKPWNTPAFQQWMKDVAAMPAEQQVEAVAKKLRELNPGFDGIVKNYELDKAPGIVNGVVTEFGFFSDTVTDISPVRALVGLEALNCTGSDGGKGILSDLSPLAGMKLTTMCCNSCKVSNLSPLAGMPLRELECYETQVEDLSLLKDMALKHLCLDFNPERDTEILRSIKTLAIINDKPTAEFWKEVEENQEEKKP